MEVSALNPQEERRYQKIIDFDGIGKEGQARIKSSSVLVIGAGGLGAPVLQYLTAIGIGSLGILDNDLIEEKNLPGQVLFGSKELGKQKAIVAKQKLIELNHLVNFNVHNICITPDNVLSFCQEYDIIVDATDNFPAKYLINDACVILKRKWIFGAVSHLEGHFTVFDGRNGPTLRCFYPEKPQRDKTQKGELGILPGIIGLMQACEVVKLITGMGNVFMGELRKFNLLENTFHTQKIEVNPENLKINSI
ncbi:MAG: HesA/MoeB/ThiF family protein [Bacteroidota bacterium]